LYRHAVEDLVRRGTFQPFWSEAEAAESRSTTSSERRGTWKLCRSAAYELIEHPSADTAPDRRQAMEAAARRVGMCFGQQMLESSGRHIATAMRDISTQLLAVAQQEADDESSQATSAASGHPASSETRSNK
jgi:hypothetical protein